MGGADGAPGATRRRRLVATGSSPAPSGRGAGVTTWWLDEGTGALEPVASRELPSPSWVTWHPHLPVLYAVAEQEAGAVTAMAVDGAGRLRVLGAAPTGGAAPCHLAVTADGRFLLAANYAGGSVAVLALGRDGALGERTDLARHTGTGADPDRQDVPHPHQVVVLDALEGGLLGGAPRGAAPVVLVADLGTDAVHRYHLTAAGRLRPLPVLGVPPGTGPRQVLVVGSGPAQRLLVLGELSGDLLALAESPSAGLRLVGSAPTSAGGGAGPVYPAQLLAAADDGERVLVSNRGPGTVAVLDARPLRRVAEHPVGALWPRHVARAGDLLLVAGERSDVLVVLRLVDGGTGVRELSRHATGSPTCVAPRP